jgi:hypothetical protein
MRLATRLTTSLCEEVQLTASRTEKGSIWGSIPKALGSTFSLGAFEVDTTFGSEAPKGLATVSLQTGAHCPRSNLLPLEYCRVSLATTRRLHIWLNYGVNSPQASRELSWLRR